MVKSWQEQSRVEWQDNDGTKITTDKRLKLGCLQRIADATELMAKDHARLVAKADYQKRRADENWQEAHRRFHTIAGLRGYITRLKKKLELKGKP